MNYTLKVEQIMETKLARIAEAVRNRPKERLTSLVHLVNMDTLEQCHHEMVYGNPQKGTDPHYALSTMV